MINTILIVFLFFGAMLLALWQASNIIAIFYGSLFVKANSRNIQKILRDFAHKDLIFYDLGCGNGDILLLANNLKMKATGFEIAPFYYLLSWWRCLRYKNIKVKYQNILRADISRANIIYCYLLPPLLKKLSKKFTREVEKGAIIVSAGFPIENFKLLKQYNIRNKNYFVYIK